MSLYSPLDLKNILIVDVAGTPEVFSFFSMLMVAFLLSKFSFPNRINLALFGLFGVLMATYMQGIYVLIILFAGLATYTGFSKFGR